jgi:uncharacterized protein (DUF2236 family)
MTMRETTIDELEAALASIRQATPDPVAGLFGPTSEVWQKNGEAIMFAGAGRAALLQLAHPAVAQAVDQFSITRRDRLARFRKTFYYVFAMVFGELETALSMARAVHQMHARVHGEILDDDAGPSFPRGAPFFANEPEAQLWVASTLFDSSAWVYEKLVRPLTQIEKSRWMGEYPRFCSLFGIPTSLVPSTWLDFESYNHRMWRSDVLTVSRTARELKEVLIRPPSQALAPFWHWYGLFTAGCLPARIRSQYGFQWGVKERAIFLSSLGALRGLRRSLPARVRMLPVYRRAMARVDRRPPSLVDQAIDRLVFGELAHVGT